MKPSHLLASAPILLSLALPCLARAMAAPPPAPSDIRMASNQALCVVPAGPGPGYDLVLAPCSLTSVGWERGNGLLEWMEPADAGPSFLVAATLFSTQWQDAAVFTWWWDASLPGEAWTSGGDGTWYMTNPDGSRWCLTTPGGGIVGQTTQVVIEACVPNLATQRWVGP